MQRFLLNKYDMRISVMFSIGNKAQCISITRFYKKNSSIIAQLRFWQFWLETFTNCYFNKIFLIRQIH